MIEETEYPKKRKDWTPKEKLFMRKWTIIRIMTRVFATLYFIMLGISGNNYLLIERIAEKNPSDFWFFGIHLTILFSLMELRISRASLTKEQRVETYFWTNRTSTFKKAYALFFIATGFITLYAIATNNGSSPAILDAWVLNVFGTVSAIFGIIFWFQYKKWIRKFLHNEKSIF